MSHLRVAAHVHSTWSYDGEWTLEDLSRAFARRGYDAVLMSEHDRTFDTARWEEFQAACTAVPPGGALLVPGIEYSDAENLVHVPVWGAQEFLGRHRPTGELLEDARAAGAVAVIAHPDRRDAWRALGPRWLELAHGIEIWNRKCDGWAPSHAGLQLAAAAGGTLRPFVGLDFHSARQFFPLAMTGPATAITVEGVLAALRSAALQPVAFRSPAARFSQGRGLEAVRASERVRRPLAWAARRAARSLSARR